MTLTSLCSLNSRSTSLSQVVRDLCKYWGIDGGSDSFGLKFESGDEYVTETSKKTIKDGTILKLCISARCLAKEIIDKMSSNDDSISLKGCNSISQASSDYVVVEHFVSFGGINLLLGFLNGSRIMNTSSAQLHCETALLGALVEIMKHEDTPLAWDDDRFDASFVLRVSQNVCTFDKSSDKRNTCELPRLKHSLAILDNLCQST